MKKKNDAKLLTLNFYINSKDQLYVEFKEKKNLEERLNKYQKIYVHNFLIEGYCVKVSKRGIYLENFSIVKNSTDLKENDKNGLFKYELKQIVKVKNIEEVYGEGFIYPRRYEDLFGKTVDIYMRSYRESQAYPVGEKYYTVIDISNNEIYNNVPESFLKEN